MTVIDVNTGKYIGSGGNLEQTVTRNNLEAAEEIVRQLRLRDVGGIVVIDFIDMVLESNRDLVLRRLTECLGRDRTKHQVAEVTSLGLVQMTRKRVGEGLLEAFSEPCEVCHGRGVIVHAEPIVEPPRRRCRRRARRRAAARSRRDRNNARDPRGRRPRADRSRAPPRRGVRDGRDPQGDPPRRRGRAEGEQFDDLDNGAGDRRPRRRDSHDGDAVAAGAFADEVTLADESDQVDDDIRAEDELTAVPEDGSTVPDARRSSRRDSAEPAQSELALGPDGPTRADQPGQPEQPERRGRCGPARHAGAARPAARPDRRWSRPRPSADARFASRARRAVTWTQAH